MASASTLCKYILDVNNTVVEGTHEWTDYTGVKHLRIYARPNKWHQNECPHCHRKCPSYDTQTNHPKHWRSLDFSGIMVEIVSQTHRICCPEHGVVVADVPWAYPDSSFTKDFDMEVTWLALELSKSKVCKLMRIDWKTIGRCISRTLGVLEPDRSRRLDGLVNIGIDETSFKRGHRYLTVVVNHDTNCVVWVAQGYGKSVLEKFFEELTAEQRSSIKVVTADGARWIADCVARYLPNCVRCMDGFHVIEWAMQALDEVRRDAWHRANDMAKQMASNHPRKRGRPRSDDEASAAVSDAKRAADEIKGSAYALGKAPENLTENQQIRLEMIAQKDNKLYRAYLMKERLRLILKITDADEAEAELDKWLWWASHSRIPAFKELYKKIKRHKESILNTIRYKMSNARIEAINNKIKLIIRKAYGFRNIQNLIDMIYLGCSDIIVPLPNRGKNALQAA